MDDALARRLLEVSEIHGDFVLSSGRHSSIYFDKFRFLSDPSLLGELADAVAALLPNDVTLVAAPEGAATLLLAAVALQTKVPMAVVRKQRKSYGTMALVEGRVEPGARAALIEDVSTTGRQVERAAKALEAEGVEVAAIILAIDRGGGEALRKAGYRVEAVVSASIE